MSLSHLAIESTVKCAACHTAHVHKYVHECMHMTVITVVGHISFSDTHELLISAPQCTPYAKIFVTYEGGPFKEMYAALHGEGVVFLHMWPFPFTHWCIVLCWQVAMTAYLCVV